MRADNDKALGYSVESCKDESKAQQCPEEKWEEEELKISNNVCELFYDTRSGEDWDKENEVKILEPHSCGNLDETGKKGHDLSAEKVDPVIYMDKNVMACDLPEIVVCYNDNTYHVVKDICVDEGVPVQEKFLFGDDKDLVKPDKTNVNPSEISSSEDRISDVGDAQGSSNYSQDHLTVTEKIKDSSEISLEEHSKKEVAEYLTLGDILSREEHHKSLHNDDGKRLEEHSLPHLQDDGKRSLETTGLETELKKTEEKLSSASTATPQEPNKACNDMEKPETENHKQNGLLENSYEDDKRSSSRFGETSFSAAESVSISGHITYSGPIVYSGSLSVRSDASTTSGRSFAFPILQSEWNSSPVRMAKADKRRKKGGWRHTLLCCRFS